MSERTVTLNYEAEYYRLCERVKDLEDRCETQKELIKELEKAIAVLSAQMDVVKMIFGRKK